MELIDSMTVRTFEIPSKSDPNLVHIVKLNTNDELSCDCKGFQYGGKCWHVRNVALTLETTK